MSATGLRPLSGALSRERAARQVEQDLQPADEPGLVRN